MKKKDENFTEGVLANGPSGEEILGRRSFIKVTGITAVFALIDSACGADNNSSDDDGSQEPTSGSDSDSDADSDADSDSDSDADSDSDSDADSDSDSDADSDSGTDEDTDTDTDVDTDADTEADTDADTDADTHADTDTDTDTDADSDTDSAAAKAQLAAACGTWCGACPAYVGTHSEDESIPRPSPWGECDGCLGGGRLASHCRTCNIRLCALDKQDDARCTNCEDLPCYRITNLIHQGPGYLHRQEYLPNLEKIRDMGVQEWAVYEEERWRCPNCGLPMIWYDTACARCGEPRSEDLFPVTEETPRPYP